MLNPTGWWLALAPIDLRCGVDRLLLQVQSMLGRDPCDGGAYLFRNRAGTRIKVLCVDAQAVWLSVRRLHEGRFVWPRVGDAVCALTAQQFAWLAAGVHWQRLSQRLEGLGKRVSPVSHARPGAHPRSRRLRESVRLALLSSGIGALLDIPGYRILRPLGQGGMATVYLAMQESLAREVALKVLAPALAEDATARERFLREARTAAQLHHPNIIAIHDVGTYAGGAYMAMEFEAAGTAAPVAGTALPADAALRIVRDTATALDYAHAHGVVHRDIKPENILRRANGSAVLTDFGIARAIEGESTFTQEGTSVGTPHYMSPEQLRGHRLDGRSDLYSLGVMMYQLLTGELPYRGTDGWAIGMQHLTATVPRLPGTLAGLQPLLDALMAKDRSHRPQSGADVVARIDRLLTGAQSTPTVGLDHSSLPKQRSRRWPALVALGLALLAGVVAWHLWRADPVPAVSPAAGIASTAPPTALPSIAVLPFADLSPGKDQEYFSDGLAEELLTRLTRVAGLRVIARTSSFSFKGNDVNLANIGKTLNVASVLEGSVRRSGDRVRITAQLVQVSDSSHLWSESYDRQLTDVFAVQEDIAAAVVEALRVRLLPGSASDPSARHKPSPEAYDQFLMGRQWFNRGSAEGMASALSAYRKAVSLDPNYAAAFAGLAVVEYAASDGYNFVNNGALRAAGRQRAMDAAERAVALDPQLADGYSVRGFIRMIAAWDWAGARADLDRAEALNPNDSFNLVRRARLHAAMGELPEALAKIRRAIEADPLSPPAWNFRGRFEAANGDLIAARQAQMRVLAITPEHGRAPVDLGLVDLLGGKAKEARAGYSQVRDEPLRLLGLAASEHSLGNAALASQALDELKVKYANGAAYQIAEVHAWRGEPDQAFEWLGRAIEQGDGGLQYIKYDPMLRGLVADPRYRQLLDRLGLPLEP